MSLTEPDRKDPYGLAGKRTQARFSSPRIRRLRGPPIIPRWLKNGAYDFAVDIWYSKDEARAKKLARRRK